MTCMAESGRLKANMIIKTSHKPSHKPTVLCCSALDPTGGAGLQADAGSILSQQCHPISIATAMTAQNTRDVDDVFPLPSHQIWRQFSSICHDDIDIHCIKVGLLGNLSSMKVIRKIIENLKAVPCVIDPILRAGGGYSFCDQAHLDAFVKIMLPGATVLTPNYAELLALGRVLGVHGQASITEHVDAIGQQGVSFVWLTTADISGDRIVNQLYETRSHRAPRILYQGKCQKLPYIYHGSGCTLSATLAACLAQGMPMKQAAKKAQRVTLYALQKAYAVGSGQMIPKRI